MTCPKCGGTEFVHFPDSLADGCVGCGTILVLGKLVMVTVQSWAKHMYEAARRLKETKTESGDNS